MSSIGTAYVTIRPDTSGFRAATSAEVQRTARASSRKLDREFSTAGKRAGRSFGRGFGGATKILAGGLLAGGLIQTLRGLGQAAAEEEKRVALLGNALRNTGAAATLFGRDIDKVIEAESRLKGFTDTELTAAFTTLLRVVGDTAEAFDLVKVAEDVARGTGRDLQTVTLALARAQQGSVAGLSRLQIVVPKLTEAEKQLGAEQRKRALATRALETVTQRFGGAAAASANTAAGQFARFNVAVGELQESLGAALAPAAGRAAKAVSDFLGDERNQARIQRQVNEVVRAGTQIVKGLADALRITKAVLDPLVRAVGGFENAAKLAFGAFAISRILKLVTAMKGLRTAALGVAAANAAAGATGGGAVAALFAGSRAGLPGLALASGYVAGRQLSKATGAEVVAKAAGGAIFDLGQKIGLFKDEVELSADDIIKKRDELLAGLRQRRTQEALERGLPGGPGAGGPVLDVAAATAAVRQRSDLDYRLELARAQATKTTGDEIALYERRRSYIQRVITRLEADKTQSTAQKQRLEGLYAERAALDEEIVGIQAAARDAAVQRAEEQKAALEQARADQQARLEEARAAYSQSISDQQEEFNLRVQRATLTERSLKDDQAAQKQLVEFLRAQVNNLQLSRQERRQYESELISATLELRQLDRERAKRTRELAKRERVSAASPFGFARSTIGAGAGKGTETAGGGGFSLQEFYQSAVQQFRQFGSNITARGGVLSPQGARAQVALEALGGAGDRAVQLAQSTRANQLTEAQKQTALLNGILSAVTGATNPATADRRRPVPGGLTVGGTILMARLASDAQVVN